MWPRALFWTVSLVLLTAGSRAGADVWAEAVDRQLDEMVAAARSEGWFEVGSRQGGSLAAREADALLVEVPDAAEWMVIGACDQDCSDLDLRALGGGESVLAEDIADDDVPMLELSGGIAGRKLEIEVGMVECSNAPCFWGVAVMAFSPARPGRGREEAAAAEGRPVAAGTGGPVPSGPIGRPSPPGVGVPRVWAVLVGISDYAGEENDLAYTADDARRMRRALVDGAGMRLEDSLLLVDGEATVSAFRSAFDTLAGRIGPEDTFVLFFSGHGDRVAREQFQASDPDALDETLSFVDGELTDDELAALLDRIRAARTLVVLDSCFSGGFAKDVISVPGRMGLFSSEEDVVSQVAAKFRAGGFLAAFLAEGIGDGYADDGDGQLTALELSQYVYERYRNDVKGKKAVGDEIVDTTDRLGYQHLVVDRGSIPPSAALFRVFR